MFHGTLTIVTKIRPSKVAALEGLLKELNERILQGAAHPFEQVEGLYFARWGILAPGPEGERLLVFGADFSAGDGGRRKQMKAFLERFVGGLAVHRHEPGPRAFDAIYRSCEGYPSKGLRKPARVWAYLRAHSVHYTARHVDFAYRVETAEGMRRLLVMSEEAERYLNTSRHRLEAPAWDGNGWAAGVHQELQQALPSLQPALADPEWRRRWDVARLSAARATLLYPALRYLVALPLVGTFKAVAALEKGLRGLFQHGGSAVARPRHGQAQASRHEREPQGLVQNPMIHAATLEPGVGARIALWVTLRSVNLRLRRYVVGLNHIRAIHCARWVLLKHRRSGKGSLFRPRTRRLLFFSNYDGSWESYIDSFVDDPEVKRFLEEIWSGTEDFPPHKSGLPFVEPFKAWIRWKQVPTRVWYSSHLHGPQGRMEPSITDLHHLLRLRALLAEQDVSAAAREQALRSFLSRGVFATEPHMMKAREWWNYILLRRAPRERGRRLTHGRKDHVATRALTDIAAQEGRTAPAGSRRHPGAGAAWLQGHERGLLPAAEDRRSPQGAELAEGNAP